MAEHTYEDIFRWVKRGLMAGAVDLDAYTRAMMATGGVPMERRAAVLRQQLGLTDEVLKTLQSLSMPERDPRASWSSLEARLSEHPERLIEQPEQSAEASPLVSTQPLGSVSGKHARYTMGRHIGRGSSARVVLARDHYLGREVAMKIQMPLPDDRGHLKARFMEEAQATGQLEHPNIIPVYDMGVLDTGEHFYTMKYVRKSNFRRVIHQLRLGRPEALRHYSLIKLLTIFNQVCMAVDYAHSKGVIHRDLKPENLLLGDYGEVIVMDWGIAKVIGDEIQTTSSAIGRKNTPENTVYGTPEYMAPEQAMGFSNHPAVDIYSLGAVLYEILCLSPPFEGKTPVKTMIAVVREKLVPPTERAVEFGRHVPPLLEEICLTAMNKKPELRQASAKALRDQIEDYVEGYRHEAHHRKMAEAHVESANRVARRYFHYVGRAEEHGKVVRDRARQFEGWEPIEEKREVWAEEAELARLHAEAVQALGEAEAAYLQALAYEPENDTARQGLARLYWTRLEEAEVAGDKLQALYQKTLVERNDTGPFADKLRGDGQITITSEPKGVLVELHRLEEIDKRLQITASWSAGHTPADLPLITMGRYKATLQNPDGPPVTLSFKIERGTTLALHTPLLASYALGDDFLFIPPGPVTLGEDSLGASSLPRQTLDLDGFVIARYPVTMAEYLEFINDLDRLAPEAAIAHMPRTKGDGILCQKSQAGHYEPIDRLITGPARKRYPEGQGHEWFLPAFGINFFDALAYIAWRCERDGRLYRLPTELEWEKAARGADGRLYPWGDHFDPTFCKMSRSRPEPAQPEPVGVFEFDCSPYGVRDMAGGVSEWTSSLFTLAGPTFEQRSQLDPQLTTFERVCRGGAWNAHPIFSRATFRAPVMPRSREPSIGFRLVLVPSSGPDEATRPRPRID